MQDLRNWSDEVVYASYVCHGISKGLPDGLQCLVVDERKARGAQPPQSTLSGLMSWILALRSWETPSELHTIRPNCSSVFLLEPMTYNFVQRLVTGAQNTTRILPWKWLSKYNTNIFWIAWTPKRGLLNFDNFATIFEKLAISIPCFSTGHLLKIGQKPANLQHAIRKIGKKPLRYKDGYRLVQDCGQT